MAQYVYTMNRVSKIVPPKRQILRDISLSFFPGAKIGVLGLNGSGKSTLLKIMAGVDREIEGLPTRPQDPFQVRAEDVAEFKNEIFPYWQGKTLEDVLDERIGGEMRAIGKVAKINQTDHAQGHICPDTQRWLTYGPSGLIELAQAAKQEHPQQAEFYDGLILSLEGAKIFMRRYAALARELAKTGKKLVVITNSPYLDAPEYGTVVLTYGNSPEHVNRIAEALFE